MIGKKNRVNNIGKNFQGEQKFQLPNGKFFVLIGNRYSSPMVFFVRKYFCCKFNSQVSERKYHRGFLTMRFIYIFVFISLRKCVFIPLKVMLLKYTILFSRLLEKQKPFTYLQCNYSYIIENSGENSDSMKNQGRNYSTWRFRKSKIKTGFFFFKVAFEVFKPPLSVSCGEKLTKSCD